MSESHTPKTSSQYGHLVAKLAKIAKTQEAANEPSNERLAQALGKLTAQQATSESNKVLRAAVAKIAKTQKAQGPNDKVLAAALRRMTASPDFQGQNRSLKAALERLTEQPQTDQSVRLKAITDVKSSDPAAASIRSALASLDSALHEHRPPDTLRKTELDAMRAGMKQALKFDLNPWLHHEPMFQESASEALEADWQRVAFDLRRSIENLLRQLAQLPDQERRQITNALIQRLRAAAPE